MFASTARPYDKRFNRKAWTLHCRHSRSKVAVGGDPERSPTARKLRHGTARTLITQTGGSVLVKAPKEHPRGANAVISTRRIHLGGGCRYLCSPVATGDGASERSNSASRYYAVVGDATRGGVRRRWPYPPRRRPRRAPGPEVINSTWSRCLLLAPTRPVVSLSAGRRSSPRRGAPSLRLRPTCSHPKSVSVASGLADQGTKSVIYECHCRALEVVLRCTGAEVFRSHPGRKRRGRRGNRRVVAANFSRRRTRSVTRELKARGWRDDGQPAP